MCNSVNTFGKQVVLDAAGMASKDDAPTRTAGVSASTAPAQISAAPLQSRAATIAEQAAAGEADRAARDKQKDLVATLDIPAAPAVTQDMNGNAPIVLSKGSGQSIGKKVQDMIASGPMCTDEDKIAAIEADPHGLNEVGMAERFAKDGRHYAKYCPDRQSWLRWNGKVWKPAKAEDLHSPLISMIQTQVAACRGLLRACDPEGISQNPLARKILAMANYFCHSLNKTPLTNILALAQPMMAVRESELNTHPHLIVCKNGTVNLRTKTLMGEMLPSDEAQGIYGGWQGEFRREDLITQYRDINYNPEAECPRLARFFVSAFGGSVETIGFVKRWMGYNLTGDVSAEKLTIFEGFGGSGKSIIIDEMQAVSGDAGVTCPFGIWTKGRIDRDGEAPSPFLSDLEGARCITCSEVQEGQILHSARIKSFTGGDTIAARKLKQDPRYFKPVGKLSFFCNDLPRVDILDSGFWRRCLVVNMPYVPDDEHRDETLKILIKEDPAAREYLLRMAVEGAAEWYETGLNPPVEVRNAMARYKDEQDPLKDFLEDERINDCRSEPQPEDGSARFWSPFADILGAFNSIREQNAERPMSKKALAALLTGAGFDARRGYVGASQVRGYAGIVVDTTQFKVWMSK
jgi:P4 family phage/plasmid primase-like protien